MNLEVADLEVKFLSNDTSSVYYDEGLNAKLLPQFYKLRCSVFSEAGPLDFVSEEPSEYDLHKDSYTAVLVGVDGRVFGGRKICVHEPRSSTVLRTDVRVLNNENEFVSIKKALAHLDIVNIRHAFFSGLCLDKIVRGKGYFHAFNSLNIDFVKLLGCSFVSTQSVPTNFIRMLESAITCGATQIMAMPHQRATSGTFRTYISFLDESKLPLLASSNELHLRLTRDILVSLKSSASDWEALFPPHYSYR